MLFEMDIRSYENVFTEDRSVQGINEELETIVLEKRVLLNILKITLELLKVEFISDWEPEVKLSLRS